MNPEDAPPPVNPIDRLADAMTLLTQISGMQFSTASSKTTTVKAPNSFQGESSADARDFLSTFKMWAVVQGTSMNVVDQFGRAVGHRDVEWIRSALSFMEGPASEWARPAKDLLGEGETPFEGSWATFREQFKIRFESANEQVEAKKKLRGLYQGRSTVPEYAARFQQLTSLTDYSLPDQRERFYEHLTDEIKDALVHTARPIATLDQLITAAIDYDARIRQRRAERDRPWKKRTGTDASPPVTRTTPVVPPVPPTSEGDPNLMAVDATRTREEFYRRMKGRCFGCGSAAHAKKDGGHERDHCAHCNRPGHRESVCMERFLGKPKTQKTAATEEASGSDFDPLEWVEGLPEGSVIAEIASTSSSTTRVATEIVLNQLLEQQKVTAKQQKALAEQIAALRDQDF